MYIRPFNTIKPTHSIHVGVGARSKKRSSPVILRIDGDRRLIVVSRRTLTRKRAHGEDRVDVLLNRICAREFALVYCITRYDTDETTSLGDRSGRDVFFFFLSSRGCPKRETDDCDNRQ